MSNENDFRVKIWGARGSYPTPGGDYAVYGGNTSCVEVNVGGRKIVFDAGTGLIPLGKSLQKDKCDRILLFLSHTHQDHILGLPFFKPIWITGKRIDIFGPDLFDVKLRDILDTWFSAPLAAFFIEDAAAKITVNSVNQWDVLIFPLDSQEVIIVRNRSEKIEISENDAVMSIHKNFSHPKGGSFSYKISFRGKTFCYVTDTENYQGGDRKVGDFVKQSDLLVHDCHFSDEDYPDHQGFGHSSLGNVVAQAKRAEVKKLILFHLNPEYDDEKIEELEKKGKSIFPETSAAREGSEYYL
ncbi:MBL fold metallo-hydrolase [candidate division WOR-3 bacterium]|nr:MBL fold metallo-hydrolase [candidate division WOR-3 bacterium]